MGTSARVTPSLMGSTAPLAETWAGQILRPRHSKDLG